MRASDPDDLCPYCIQDNADGTVDVILHPEVITYRSDLCTEYDVKALIVRGVIPWCGLDDSIRTDYDSWCEKGEAIYL